MKRSRHLPNVTLWGVLFSSTALANAAPVSIINHGFEDDTVPDGTFSLFIPTGWSLYDPDGILGGGNSVGVLNPTGTSFFPGGAPEGSNVALTFPNGTDGPNPGTPSVLGLAQTLASNLEANTTYTLAVEVGNIASGTGLPPADAFGFFNLQGFPGYRIELLAGGTVVAEDANTLLPGEGLFESSIVQVTVGPADPLVGQPMGIRLINLNQPGTPSAPAIEVDFDDVRLDATAVPAPTSVALFLSAISGLFWVGRGRPLARARRPFVGA